MLDSKKGRARIQQLYGFFSGARCCKLLILSYSRREGKMLLKNSKQQWIGGSKKEGMEVCIWKVTPGSKLGETWIQIPCELWFESRRNRIPSVRCPNFTFPWNLFACVCLFVCSTQLVTFALGPIIMFVYSESGSNPYTQPGPSGTHTQFQFGLGSLIHSCKWMFAHSLIHFCGRIQTSPKLKRKFHRTNQRMNEWTWLAWLIFPPS